MEQEKIILKGLIQGTDLSIYESIISNSRVISNHTVREFKNNQNKKLHVRYIFGKRIKFGNNIAELQPLNIHFYCVNHKKTIHHCVIKGL